MNKVFKNKAQRCSTPLKDNILKVSPGKTHYLGLGCSKLKAAHPMNYFPGFLGKNLKNCPSSKLFLFTSLPQSLKINKEFSSKSSNWAKIHFKWLYFVKKFSSLGSQTIISGPFTSPSVRPFGLHTYTKLKVKCPPPRECIILGQSNNLIIPIQPDHTINSP